MEKRIMTLDNLQAAFNGESNAHNRYLAFARKADEEGYAPVASLFRAAAAAERIHADAHANVIRKLSAAPKADIVQVQPKSTRENLAIAIKGETYERDVMYPDFIQQAKAEKLKGAITTFEFALAAEAEHARLYQAALDHLADWRGGKKGLLRLPDLWLHPRAAPRRPLPGLPRAGRSLQHLELTGARMGLLEGKKGLILNIANDRSIAWHIAASAIQQGATCGFGYLPVEKMERRVRKAMEEGGFANEWLFPCDVSRDEDIDRFFAAAAQQFGTIDFLVHCLAFADRRFLQIGAFTSTPRDVFKQALDISAYSLLALTRGALPLMPNGGSVIALTYLGSEKAVAGYNVMGVAKAALESTMRYLAFELGEKKIRVNTLSAGPMRTLSAMAVGGDR